jgi:hypothetical protein
VTVPLGESQQRELAQLLLVAQVYLDLADPEGGEDEIPLGATKDAFVSGARLSLDDWSRAQKAAHLASAAIRLASIDQVLDKAHEGRPVYQECRRYFGRGGKTLPADPRGSACEEWFHVMLRDAVAHNEPPDEDTPEWLAVRFEARQLSIEATPFDRALGCLRQTAKHLAGVMKGLGIVLPELPTGPVAG